MKKRFVFHDENNDKDWVFFVDIDEKLSEEEIETLTDELIEDSDELESEYGVHDVAFDEGDILGFTSYEIEEDKFPELIEKWKKIFENEE